MLTKTIKYKDFDGNERTETFRFNLTKTELAQLEFSYEGGLQKMLTRIVESQDNKQIVEILTKIVLLAYGEKSDDGRRFVKGEDVSKAFSETLAFDQLIWELMTEADIASGFINGLIPDDLKEK